LPVTDYCCLWYGDSVGYCYLLPNRNVLVAVSMGTW